MPRNFSAIMRVEVEGLVRRDSPKLRAHPVVQRLGEGLGQTVGQRRGEDGGVVVAGGLEARGDLRLAEAGGDREAADVVGPAPIGRDEIGQGDVGAALALGHLLAKGVEARALGRAGLVGPDDDVVAVGVGRPEADDAAGFEPALGDDPLQHGLRVSEQIARRLADDLVLQDPG